MACLRLVASGLPDKYPDIKLLIGHRGEVLPCYLDRLEVSQEDKEKTAHLDGEKLLGLSEWPCKEMKGIRIETLNYPFFNGEKVIENVAIRKSIFATLSQ